MRTRALRELLLHCMREPAFDQLRTKEALGYIVSTGAIYNAGVDGMYILVQSERPPQYLRSRVEAFLVQFRAKLEAMSEGEFATLKSAVVDKKRERPKRLSQWAQRLAGEIERQTYFFDRLVKVADELDKRVCKADLIAFFDAHVAVGGEKRRSILFNLTSDKVGQGKGAAEAGASVVAGGADDASVGVALSAAIAIGSARAAAGAAAGAAAATAAGTAGSAAAAGTAAAAAVASFPVPIEGGVKAWQRQQPVSAAENSPGGAVSAM